MDRKTTGLIGLSILVFFILSFLSLFIYNPQTLEEVNNIPSIASYNLVGMNGRGLVIYLNYVSLGILNLIFAFGLFLNSKNDLPIVIAKIFILLAGLIWISFGVISWDPNSDEYNHLFLIRLISLLTVIPFGLIILGAEYEKIVRDNFSKRFTLATGLIILIIGILSAFVFNDQTWIRTNISLILYFLWFGVIGARLVQKSQRPT